MITHILVLDSKHLIQSKKTQKAQKNEKLVFQKTEAFAGRCSVRRVFLGVSRDSRASACGGFSFFMLRRRFRCRCFPVGFAKFLGAPFLAEYLRWLLLKRNCRNTDLHKPVLNKIMTA